MLTLLSTLWGQLTPAKRVMLGAVALLLLALLGWLGAMAGRTTTERTLREAVEKKLEAELAITATMSHQLSQLTVERNALERRYKSRLAVVDGEGHVQLDGQGHPIFNTSSGSETALAETSRLLQERSDEVIALQARVGEYETVVKELVTKTSSSKSVWKRARVGWEQPGDRLTDLTRGRGHVGLGVNLSLLGMVIGPTYELVIPADGEPWQAEFLRHVVSVDLSF